MVITPGNNKTHLRDGLVSGQGRMDPGGRSLRNLILLSIPDDEYNLLRPHLEFVDLEHHQILHDPWEQIEHGYFPEQGMVSLVVATSDGRSVEVGIVGREGFVGAPLVVGLKSSPQRAIVQISGKGARISAKALATLFPSLPRLQFMLNGYAHIQGVAVAQVAACNRLHEIDQRLARWLLMTQDRVELDWLRITHDFLAAMLGTGRPSLSVAAGDLQRAGLISCARGALRIIDRKGLEQAACECYRVIRDFNGELGLTLPSTLPIAPA